ncbi:hypothetical protein Rs2_27405 [Raphanus sativus]|uniref:Uncharacterized protein LOC108810608 n=1 Tax=Raphanus sativus TaxID=3726 RepID=A0A6J0JT29_RAPSA|nr:uncharacterized protein LOC108810608 [Raphanus sativus]XP_056842930.1 uncharacterized protein LOC130495543 [Raphanus sativus]KAJ4869417.1 hypothetical protein Rs2_49034 [Raphanus sativus]KAJ4887657.1 hypothetical protein Rs2_27405 [Raphanus sativus]
MGRISLAVGLVLLVALSNVYETQAQTQGKTFSVLDYLALFPKTGKEFGPYASKGLLDFVGALEGKSPTTVEFKNFFTNLKGYITSCFQPAPPGSGKSDQLFTAISALKGSLAGTSFDSWRLIEALVSMEKVSTEMKTSTSNVKMPDPQWERLSGSMFEWVGRIGLFVKAVSEINGKPIDLKQFDIDYTDPTYASLSKQAGVRQSTSPFSLPAYLRNIPKTGKEVEPFAYKGMQSFLLDLETRCLANKEFKEFFVKLNDFMASFKTVSPDTYSIESDTITTKAMHLFLALSPLDGTKAGTSDPWKLVDGLVTMGDSLVEMRKSGPGAVTVEQSKQLTSSMLKWGRAVGEFVKAASAKKGVTMDISFDASPTNAAAGNGGSVPTGQSAKTKA